MYTLARQGFDNLKHKVQMLGDNVASSKVILQDLNVDKVMHMRDMTMYVFNDGSRCIHKNGTSHWTLTEHVELIGGMAFLF